MNTINQDNLYIDLDVLTSLTVGDKLEIDRSSNQFALSKNKYGVNIQNMELLLSSWSGYYVTDRTKIFEKLAQLSDAVDQYANSLISSDLLENKEASYNTRCFIYKLIGSLVGLGALEKTYPNENTIQASSEKITKVIDKLNSALYPQKDNAEIKDKILPFEIIDDYGYNYIYFSAEQELKTFGLKLAERLKSRKLFKNSKKEWNGDPEQLIQKYRACSSSSFVYQEQTQHFHADISSAKNSTFSGKLGFNANLHRSSFPLAIQLGSGASRTAGLGIRLPTSEYITDRYIINASDSSPIQAVVIAKIKKVDMKSLNNELKIYNILKGSPYFVNLVDVCQYQSKKGSDRVSLTTEWCNMGDLDSSISGISKSAPEHKNYCIYRIMHDVLHGLVEMEEKGINHQDLKPQNIFLDEDENHQLHAKIADFDLSAILDDQLHATEPLSRGGTPLYISPEFGIFIQKKQALPRSASKEEHLALNKYIANPKGDIWASGLILYKLISGELLHSTSVTPLPYILDNLIELKQEKVDQLLLRKDNIADSPFYPLVKAMLTVDFEKRPTAKQCLEIFKQLDPKMGQRPSK